MLQLPLPPIVLECPECGEKYLISNESNRPSENATFFSDGYYIDEQIWRTPGIIGCVTCELGFLPQKGKVIATPNWDDFYKNWSHIKKAEPPTAGALALELRTRRNMTPEIEKIIRKEFWFAVNHTEVGKLLLANNEKFKNFWNNSLIMFEELLDPTSNEECLLKAEVNRQLGRFEQCLSIIGSLQGKLPNAIRVEAQKENSIVVVVK